VGEKDARMETKTRKTETTHTIVVRTMTWRTFNED
jgi:hypothetical protein